ncbi:MAG: C/D box methylation guide ribonucleoprotein complex aNOP56 subunit [Candidatus Aenigmarchaeota archaeon]|nr:C/D box methylation guide ribonucleoprotein complex aNOP56 subunit [Candidatus Aenigmarchaeota archaeon]
MRAYIFTTFIGCFGVDEKNKIISFKPFPKDPEKIAEKLRLSEFEVIEEEKQIQDELWKKGYKEFVFSVRKHGVKAEPGSKGEQFIKENLRKLAIEKKFVKDQVEFNQLLTKVNLELTKVKIKKAIERDSLVIQVNRAIEEIDKSVNILVERLREFYSLHFPEMDKIIKDYEKYAKIVEKFGARQKIEDPELRQFVEKSMGIDLTDEDIKAVQSIATQILSLYKLREYLSKYLEKILREVAPNLTEIAGPMLAAKLIAKAGRMEKLAKMPSSTLQIIGAEKALFRFLRGKGKGPRFGLLFSHPMVQNAPEKLKGRVARAIAAKLSIAAKIDYYSKEYKGERLKQELQERVKEILKGE